MSHPQESALVAKHVFKQVSLPAGPSATEKHKMLHILSDINLSIYDGESVAIIGASGSGKSTLLGILAGLDLPSEGEVLFYDKALHRLDEEQRAQIRRSDIGFIFQQFHLLPELTALNNVALPLKLRGDKHAIAKAEKWLTRVGLGHRYDHKPSELSGGEQQRVAIARALVFEPKFIFADEPTGNLDPKSANDIADILFECCNEHDAGLVLVTHSEELASRAQHRFALANGQVNQQLNPTLKVASC